MIRYEFEQTKPLEAIFTSSTLTDDEHALVEAVAKWTNPGQFSDLVRMVHGRSIEFQSPSLCYTPEDYVAGRYDGLQIYGVGGTTSLPTDGILTPPSRISISPVNAQNHADQLKGIIQLQKIDADGQLVLSSRPYAPLRGMDEIEAANRKETTVLLAKALTIFEASGHRSWLRVPILAAEGNFPNLEDANGKPLRFQVYRVPLVMRFPTQFVQLTGMDEIDQMCNNFSHLLGKTLRLLHRNLFAYMDGHVGNMSLLIHNKQRKLYITDLGSMHRLDQEAFPGRYMGIDFYMYFESMEKLLTMYGQFLHSCSIDHAEEIVSDLRGLSLVAMITGYFQNELIRQHGDADQAAIATTYARAAYTAYAKLDPQQFLEYMEIFLEKICDSSQPSGTRVTVEI